MTEKEKASVAFTQIVEELPDLVFRMLKKEIDIVSTYINKEEKNNGKTKS